jgi:hypothetical protein
MRAAGFDDVDLDDVVTLGGAGGLFGYRHGDFSPKYAFLHVGFDRRITEATGFDYEWLAFDDIEGAWRIVTESVDAGKPVKAMYVEGILFIGYRDHEDPEQRLVYGISQEEPGFSKWMTWDEFAEWENTARQWQNAQLGRYTKRVGARPPAQTVCVVLEDLVQFSKQPPTEVTEKLKGTLWGLAALDQYTSDCGDMEEYPEWTICHDMNSQWPTRKCTAAWLNRLATTDLFDVNVDEHLIAASKHYQAAYESWITAFHQCGWRAPKPWKEAGKDPQRRRKAAVAIEGAAEHERAAITAIEKALAAPLEAQG